jgi:hypothetical protein
MLRKRWWEFLLVLAGLALSTSLIFFVENLLDNRFEGGEADKVLHLEIVVVGLLLGAFLLDEIVHLYKGVINPQLLSRQHGARFGMREISLLFTTLGGSLGIYLGFKYLLQMVNQ